MSGPIYLIGKSRKKIRRSMGDISTVEARNALFIDAIIDHKTGQIKDFVDKYTAFHTVIDTTTFIKLPFIHKYVHNKTIERWLKRGIILKYQDEYYIKWDLQSEFRIM